MRRTPQSVLIVGFIFVLAIAPLAAQSATSVADKLLADKNWSEAATAYSAVAAQDPGNGAAWAGLADSELQLKKYDDAITAAQHALALQYQPVLTRVRLGRAYAARQNKLKLLEILNETIGGGYSGRVRLMLLGAEEFQPYAKDPEVQSALQSMVPCQAPQFHQFDFWVGDWDVQSPTGQHLGTNLITREQDGCVLVEHWKSGRGQETGTSFSYYNFHDGKWHQFYLANQGDPASFPPTSGKLRDGKMVLENLDDPKSYSRWTYYVVSPGKVRQMAEYSSDGGKTWVPAWDSIYVKKDSAAVAQGSTSH